MQTLIDNWKLYVWAMGAAAGLSWVLTPVVRWAALRFDWLDHPSSSIKTHKVPTPSLGGIAIFISYTATLLLLRFWTQFPTGTLRSLRGLVVGGVMVFALGIVDDLKKPQGLGFKSKFAVQGLAACVLAYFDIRIHFISPDYVAIALTLIWVVGITNAFNIIDIMDGLSASQAIVAALAFLMISLPSEELYVNFASAALAGAAAGFLPWNLSKNKKIFMGDSGSMLLGFLLAGISMGTRYSDVNNIGVFAPLLILLVPMYDTFFVMYLRLRQGKSPFLGSKDHFALRLEELGYPRRDIVLLAAGAASFLGLLAFFVTQITATWALCLYLVVVIELLVLSHHLAQVTMRD